MKTTKTLCWGHHILNKQLSIAVLDDVEYNVLGRLQSIKLPLAGDDIIVVQISEGKL